MLKLKPWVVCILLIVLPHLVTGSETSEKFAEQATQFLAEGKDFQAILSYRRALSMGLKNPAVMRNMALAFYNLRMLDEAIETMEAGLEISTKTTTILTELGILYGARGDLQKASYTLQESLQMDPGQGDAYFYLGLVLIRQGKLKLAWQAARIAEKLHQDPVLLVEKLQKRGAPEPSHYPFQEPGPVIALRQIVLESERQGEELVMRWRLGDSLAEYFLGLAEGDGQPVSGYTGAFSEAELKPEILSAVEGSRIFDPPVIVHTDSNYILVQRIWPFDPIDWSESGKKGTQASTGAVPASEPPLLLGKADPRKIQLYTGAFHQKEYAVEQVLNLRALNFHAYYLEGQDREGRVLYNVIAGEFGSRDEVISAMDRLQEKGYDSFFSE